MSLLHNPISHIYIEKDLFQYPDTELVLRKYPRAVRVEISNYKEIFNRSRQSWSLQKESRKLILAKKHGTLLYKGSHFTPDFGFKNFYYTTQIMNCLFDCHYCFLQGMYPSANIVMFVNSEDYFLATKELLKTASPLYLSLSYETDLLAFEGVIPHTRRWIEFARANPELHLEVRTKSAGYNLISDITPIDNATLSWTLSPKIVAEKFELKTPSLNVRIASLLSALKDGWNVRICLDPVLYLNDWKGHYTELIHSIFEMIPRDHLSRIRDITLGTFRMNSKYFQRLSSNREDSEILYGPIARNNSAITYRPEIVTEILPFLSEKLYQYLPQDRVIWINNPNSETI